MIFYTSGKFNGVIKFYNLGAAKNEEWLKQAAVWANHKWGYMRHFPKASYYEERIRAIQNDFYIAIYASQPVGMFSLTDYTIDITKKRVETKELDFVYVDESFRGLGLGNRILQKVTDLAKEQKIDVILDTLTPNLNHFYQKRGAKIICDSVIACDKKNPFGYPTTLLRISSRAFEENSNKRNNHSDKPVPSIRSKL